MEIIHDSQYQAESCRISRGASLGVHACCRCARDVEDIHESVYQDQSCRISRDAPLGFRSHDFRFKQLEESNACPEALRSEQCSL